MAVREIKKPVTEQDIRQWERGWADMMVSIWRENILRLGIVDTRRLHDSISHSITDASGQITIAHEFMLYGIYVARGVGQGFTRGNPGDLLIMDKSYRKEHGLNKPRKRGPKWGGGYTSGKPRKKREWFAKKYLRSIYVLSEVERDLYGAAYMGTLSNVVQAIFGGAGAMGSHGTDITTSVSQF
ncbi:MAG: hypothetical protein J6I61_07845 [Prevotella sp.]|nr:hypothetical protein [Prevotella sp.]